MNSGNNDSGSLGTYFFPLLCFFTYCMYLSISVTLVFISQCILFLHIVFIFFQIGSRYVVQAGLKFVGSDDRSVSVS
jgi:hypothetical protein